MTGKMYFELTRASAVTVISATSASVSAVLGALGVLNHESAAVELGKQQGSARATLATTECLSGTFIAHGMLLHARKHLALHRSVFFSCRSSLPQSCRAFSRRQRHRGHPAETRFV